MNDKVLNHIKILFNIISILGIVATIVGAIYLWSIGAFNSTSHLQQLILSHKYLGPIIFFALQVIQVVIPIIPGGITVAVGVLIYGPFWGFIYNSLGIIIGSFILFHFGRKFGRPLAQTFVKEKTYDKYMAWLEKGQKRFNIIYTLLTLSPVAPADALVLVASQTRMTWKFFIWSTIICKPFSIFVYSYILIFGGGFLKNLL